MAVTALGKSQTTSWKGMAVQCQQLQDNNGRAVDVSVLTGSYATQNAGSTKVLTANDAGSTTFLQALTGSTVTLPVSTGSGRAYRFVVSVLATSNSHIVKVANASDTIQGIMLMGDDTSANAQWFAAVAGTDDTITLNRSTTGSVTVGEHFTLVDIATNVWQVLDGLLTNTGTSATPFSATV